MHHAWGYISPHRISFPCSLCFLLFLLSPPLCLPPPPSSPQHAPSHHPGQPMWSEWRLIQCVRPCLKCNKLPSGGGTVHLSRHITREGACAPPSLTSSSTPHPSHTNTHIHTHTHTHTFTHTYTHRHTHAHTHTHSNSLPTHPSLPSSASPGLAGFVTRHPVPQWESLALSALAQKGGQQRPGWKCGVWVWFFFFFFFLGGGGGE